MFLLCHGIIWQSCHRKSRGALCPISFPPPISCLLVMPRSENEMLGRVALLVTSCRNAAVSHLHVLQYGVRWASVTILSIFVLEGLLHWIEMGRRFFTENHGMHALDLVIVAIALTFEVRVLDWLGGGVS